MSAFRKVCSVGLHRYRGHPIGFGLQHNVFFLVTNIEYDVVPAYQSTTPDAYVGASAGEFGCWVDCQNTRILQTGTEQSGIPGCWNIGEPYWALGPISSNNVQELASGPYITPIVLKTMVFGGYTESSKLRCCIQLRPTTSLSPCCLRAPGG